jgi:DNA-binding GntR family transcriptional regulator
MTVERAEPRAGRRIGDPPSMTALAAEALRSMIVSGELQPGDSMGETRLTEQLGVSRPPLREAMRILEQEGLVVHVPRRGVVVATLSLQDVYEIVTLRRELEEMAVRLGVPVRAPERADRLRKAVETLEQNALRGSEESALPDTYRFHLAFVGLAGHTRLEATYRSLSLQFMVCMAMNRRARASVETLPQRAARHRELFELVLAGDRPAVIAGLHDPRSLTFLRQFAADQSPERPPASPEATAWLSEVLTEIGPAEGDRGNGRE